MVSVNQIGEETDGRQEGKRGKDSPIGSSTAGLVMKEESHDAYPTEIEERRLYDGLGEVEAKILGSPLAPAAEVDGDDDDGEEREKPPRVKVEPVEEVKTALAVLGGPAHPSVPRSRAFVL
jgi:hypothetical protein